MSQERNTALKEKGGEPQHRENFTGRFSSFENLFGTHVFALMMKEVREIARNKYLVFLLLVPPTIQLLILGAALDPQVRSLRLGTVDYSTTQESRSLISSFSSSGVFPSVENMLDERTLTSKLEEGKLDVGLVIPPEFAKDLNHHIPAPVQVIIDGADAYSAGIADAYTQRILNQFKPNGQSSSSAIAMSMLNMSDKSSSSGGNSSDSGSESRSDSGSNSWSNSGSGSNTVTGINLPAKIPASFVNPQIDMLYNPGELSSWFFVPGVLGAALTLTATLVASASVLRERESGTMEQLLMTPAEDWEILLAKFIPLAACLLSDVFIAVVSARIVFALPFRGNVFLFAIASVLYVTVGIGVGMLLGTLCKSQRQAQLTSFFVNIPLIVLSGTVVPYETMPPFLQALSLVDPLRYFTLIARGVILKGADFSMLWQDLLYLVLFAILIIGASMNRFRKQLT